MAQYPDKVLKDLQQNKYAPVYFLQGEEPFYIDQIAGYIERNALAETEKDFNQLVVYGKDVDITTVLNHARSYPMMGARQVVIVKEAQEIQDFSKKEARERLLQYVRDPLPSTILVFCYKNKKLDGKKALQQELEKFAEVVNSDKIYDNKLPGWINTYVQRLGCQIEEKATQMLADYIGNDLSKISQEIEKILINYRERPEGRPEGKPENKKEEKKPVINAEIVQKYVGISKEYNVFELQKAIAYRDIARANKIVNYFEANPRAHPAIPVIAFLFTFFYRILILHHTKNKPGGEEGQDLAGLLGINKFFLKEYKQASYHYPLKRTIQNIHFLREADLQAKGVGNTGTGDGQILRELIFKLMY